MPGETRESYELVVVFDDVRNHFDVVERELARLQKNFSKPTLRRMDLIFLPPSSLVCRLCISRAAPTEGSTIRLAVSQEAHFRVLDLMGLSAREREEFYTSRLKRSTWSAKNIDKPLDVLEDLRTHVGTRPDNPEHRKRSRVDLVIPARFRAGPKTAVGLTENISTKGLFMQSEIFPDVGQVVRISFETSVGRAPVELPARVAHVLNGEDARASGRPPGFGVAFELSKERTALLDSFLIAVARGRPWPERSGRRHQRFTIPVHAEYVWQGESRVEPTDNMSRGGLFLKSDSPPPVGAELSLSLFFSNSPQRTIFSGRVVHISAADRSQGQGVGFQFDESADVVEAKLRQLLGGAEIPTVHTAMIVDADSFFRALVAKSLRSVAYECLEAADCDQAFQQLLDRLTPIDLIIVDLFATGMGLESLIEKIRGLSGSREPVVVVVVDQMDDANQPKLEDLCVAQVFEKSTALAQLTSILGGNPTIAATANEDPG